MFIVIEPCFAEGHILEAHIRNVCEYFRPDHFVIVEGMFPSGPEDSLKGERMKDFKRIYTLDGTRSFDLEYMRKIVNICKSDYPHTEIHWIEMNYDQSWDTRKTYHYIYMLPNQLFNLQSDDIILPSETDLLFTAEEATQVLNKLNALIPGSFFGISMRQFFVAPYITMGVRDRRGGFKWGDGVAYDRLFQRYFFEQEYIRSISDWIACGWHYEWMRPGKYFDMRIEQTFKHGVDRIYRELKEIVDSNVGNLQERIKAFPYTDSFYVTNIKKEDHPIHIQNHENFEFYYSLRR